MKRIVNSYLIRKIINFFRTNKLKKKYYTRKYENGVSVKNSIIFCANGFLAHGGLADRIYGILTSYAICKIKNWNFTICFNSPYRLDEFLIPNMYNWLISENDVIYDLGYAKPVLRMGGCSKVDFDSIKIIKKQIHLYSNYKWLNNINEKYNTSFTWSGLFNELFNVSDALQKDLNVVRDNLPEKYVSLQVRVQNAFGDFPDCGSAELSEVNKKKLLGICESKIDSLYLEEKIPVLLTSDSQSFVDYFQALCKESLCFIPGTILHTDNNEFSGYEAHKKTFIDLFCLAMGKEIYQISHEHIYRSGFSNLAAQITGKEVKWI